MNDSEIYTSAGSADNSFARCEQQVCAAGATSKDNNTIERALGISPARDRRSRMFSQGHEYVATDRRTATELRQLILIGSLLAAYCRGDGVGASLSQAAADANALAVAWDDLLPAVRGTLLAAEAR